MGFNPITGGGGTTSAHTHSNASSDGGSLSTATQLNNGSLFAQMVAFG